MDWLAIESSFETLPLILLPKTVDIQQELQPIAIPTRYV